LEDNHIIGPEADVSFTLEDIYQARRKDLHTFGRIQHELAVVLAEAKTLSITSNT
jgi:hypothetical protein